MADRIQVAMEPTSQSILKQSQNIFTDTQDMKPRIQTTQSNVNSINARTATMDSNIGTPTDSASNGTSGSLHRKMNWLMSNGRTKPVLKVAGRSANYASGGLTNQRGTIYPYDGDATVYLDVYGSGRLLYLIGSESHYAVYVKVDGKSFMMGYEGVFDIPFSNRLRIEYGGSYEGYAPVLIYYELNQ
ncbi:hypothetical protein [Lysinibacillus sp. NPDC086135]|uniref:hypothetical protein n=1 Tax=Lysinibacillus sp. NPDC086135 TaxID=3364130 RepID=UPI00380E11ED